MHESLRYPFDPATLLKSRRRIRRELLAAGGSFTERRIAILGGSTTHDIREMLELFLLDAGIRPVFYESEYAQYYEDAMFSRELRDFAPELIFIHTSACNIRAFPAPGTSREEAEAMLDADFRRFAAMWDRLRADIGCTVVQNNFEKPYLRPMGNREGWDYAGRVRYLAALNLRFADYAAEHADFYIHDIDWLSADWGLRRWSDPKAWHLYKYALAVEAIPDFAYSLSRILCSVWGKSYKALALDLDNTLWGGVVGDDGVEGIEIGQETSSGQVYAAFQRYLKELSATGVVLNVISKNERENALAGLNHPAGVLKPEDFAAIFANWEPKGRNLRALAERIALLPESIVFVDDNPAERLNVTQELPGVVAPPLAEPEDYPALIDRAGYFERTALSGDDLRRAEMYRENAQRQELSEQFGDYTDYLHSLAMHAEVAPFSEVYIARIAQLTNKSNQFNLTTRRYTEEELRRMNADPAFLCLYGKLADRFGDNGVVTVVVGEKERELLHLRLWLMSCRVLKRDMELCMLDEVVRRARALGITALRGYYYPTAKNGMVRNLYGEFGFSKLSSDETGDVWELRLDGYENKNHVIEVE